MKSALTAALHGGAPAAPAEAPKGGKYALDPAVFPCLLSAKGEEPLEELIGQIEKIDLSTFKPAGSLPTNTVLPNGTPLVSRALARWVACARAWQNARRRKQAHSHTAVLTPLSLASPLASLACPAPPF